MNTYVFQTPGGERWYVEKIELTYNSSDEHFEHTDQPGKSSLVRRDATRADFLRPIISSSLQFLSRSRQDNQAE